MNTPTERRKVVIFEGPAGSGKSYLLDHMSERFDSDMYQFPHGKLPEIERPRSYPGLIGLMHSQLKDQRSMLHVLMADEKLVFIDRWLLSQQVYDSIRQKNVKTDPEALSYALTLAIFGINGMWQEHHGRMNLPAPKLELDLMFLVVTAPSTVTRSLRSGPEAGGRVYPYDADVETACYRSAAFTLSQLMFESINCGVTTATIHSHSIFGAGLEARPDYAEKAIRDHFYADLPAV